jgi:glycosyltransferase involved in cell wall biosynthesis
MPDARPLRILLVTRSYPAPGDLYKYPFVHRRVLAYLASGHQVAVFRPSDQPGEHRFEGVTCLSGGREALEDCARSWKPDVIAVHGFSETIWPVIEPLAESFPIRAWLHGSEIPAFFRQKAQCIEDSEERQTALQAVEVRRAFWQRFLGCKPDRLKLVFVSNAAVDLAREDLAANLRLADYAIIPNPIDTDLFAFKQKRPGDRWRVLMIRPFDSLTYGNDMAVSAIRRMSEMRDFDRLQFTIIGDGPLFESTLKPLLALRNVRIERRFLTQPEIAEEHGKHGIFLVPTRLDTQGVSRDEAMSSGLVPVTNSISAVSEFVDDSCAALAAPDDVTGLTDALQLLIDGPALFTRKSAAAANRVRMQTGHEVIIPQELELLAEARGT